MNTRRSFGKRERAHEHTGFPLLITTAVRMVATTMMDSRGSHELIDRVSEVVVLVVAAVVHHMTIHLLCTMADAIVALVPTAIM